MLTEIATFVIIFVVGALTWAHLDDSHLEETT